MSHFSTLKTKLTNAEVLTKSLSDLGYTVHQGANVAGYHGAEAKADISVTLGDGKVGLGWIWSNQNECYEAIGDFWAIDKEGVNLAQIINTLNQKYAVNQTLASVKQPGLANANIKLAVGAGF